MKFEDKDLPGLFQITDSSSLIEQKKYFKCILTYLILLIIAALFTFFSEDYPSPLIKIISAVLFLLTLIIVIWLKIHRPDDIWYNGRAVAESVKTRSWRWMMRAEPYFDNEDIEVVRKHFINDLKTILKQNGLIISKLKISESLSDPISEKMVRVRNLNIMDRFHFYKNERVAKQALWYSEKSKFNKEWAEKWFWASVSLHGLIIILLLLNIYYPLVKLPIEVIAVAASSILTWLQSKKHNELSSSYSLAAHEIVLIKSEIIHIKSEVDLSEYILNCENAFSREHTQWFARKNE